MFDVHDTLSLVIKREKNDIVFCTFKIHILKRKYVI